jgi:hypothetical protein
MVFVIPSVDIVLSRTTEDQLIDNPEFSLGKPTAMRRPRRTTSSSRTSSSRSSWLRAWRPRTG